MLDTYISVIRFNSVVATKIYFLADETAMLCDYADVNGGSRNRFPSLKHQYYKGQLASAKIRDWSKLAVNVQRLGWTTVIHARTPYQLIWHTLVTDIYNSTARGVDTYRIKGQ